MGLKIFYSYAHEDEELRDKLETHLAVLKRSGAIESWHDRKIIAGTDWRKGIGNALDDADLVLVLLSADFMASDFCYSVELKRALERYARREAMVIPVMLRPVDWESTPLAGLQGLPTDLRPITTWGNYDRAFVDVARGVRRAVEQFSTWRAPVSGKGRRAKKPAREDATVEAGALVDRTPPLRLTFDDLELRTMAWLKKALSISSAVARVEDASGQPRGTGFLVRAADLGVHDAGEDALLVTNAHMFTPDLLINGEQAYFEAVNERRKLGEVVFSSPPDELDVVLVQLEGRRVSDPLMISDIDPAAMNEATRIYVAGHPLGGGLRYSLSKNAWLDYRNPRMQYRASAQPGSGGSPVFDEFWRVVAIHRASGVNLNRLTGNGTRAACEGTTMQAIREAVEAARHAKRRR